MSDYLTSLVQRARGETGAVRPIVQPVFAPGRADLPSRSAGTLPDLAEPDAPVPAPRARAATRPAVAGQVPANAPLRAEQAAPGDPLASASQTPPAANRVSPTPPPVAETGPQPSADSQHVVEVERTIIANQPPSVARSESPARPQAVPLPLPAEAVRASEVTPLPIAEAQTAMPAFDQPAQQGTEELSPSLRPASQDAPDSASVSETPRLAAHVATRRGAGQALASEQIIPIPRGADRPASRPAAAPAPAWATASTQAPASPAPPAIRVSIGRIEVRAMMPAPPPPPPPMAAPAAPLVTLEAYLRERTGRRDR
jgi:hypothetical protein